MLIGELRELLKKYKEDDLRHIIAEMYKSMPKKLKEDKDIDKLLRDLKGYMSIGKNEDQQSKPMDFERKYLEIGEFINHAYNQYYLAPNQVVHKKERPKWRFKVKGYIKELQGIGVETKEGKTATELLQKIYEMLSYACGYYLFNTDNPFKSVGVEQGMLLDMVVKRKLIAGVNQDVLMSSIKLVVSHDVDRETLHSFLIQIFIMNLKSADSKIMAIEQCKLLKEEMNKSKIPTPKNTWNSNNYELSRQINNLVEMVFRIYTELGEYEEAIQYFYMNYDEKDKEIRLYVLLHLLLAYELGDYWIREYESEVNKGIEPRGELVRIYKKIKYNEEESF